MSTTARTPSARVSALRALSVVLAFTAAVGLVFGTAGFTAMEADRGVDVNVTDDENAYLGYNETVTQTSTSHNNTTTVTATVEAEYRNRLTEDLTLTVTAEADGSSTEEPLDISKGEAKSVEISRTCSPGEKIVFTFDATGSGSDVSVSLERRREVVCSS